MMKILWHVRRTANFSMAIFLLSCGDPVTLLTPAESVDIYGTGWSATHADGANTDFSETNIPGQVELAWYKKFDGTINLGPSFGDDGTVFITTSGEGCHLYALDPVTGDTKWCSPKLNEFAVASGVLIDKDQRLFIADNQRMYAFDARGKILWSVGIDGFPFSAQFTQTGRLIFITHIGTIYVLDRKTGKEVLQPKKLIDSETAVRDFDPRACMQGTRDCPCANTPAFDNSTGNIYFTFWFPGASQASLVAMRYTEDSTPSLEMIWQNNQLPGGSASSPDLSYDRKTVYVNDNVNSVHAIDTKSGEVRWSYNIGYKPGGSQSTSPEGYILPGGGADAKLMCIRDNAVSASLIWKSDTLENRGIATQAEGGLAIATIKVGMLSYELVILNVSDGAILERHRLPAKPLFSVGTTVGVNGLILVPTFNGYLYAYKKRD